MRISSFSYRGPVDDTVAEFILDVHDNGNNKTELFEKSVW